jgi:hypothetical protein
MKSSFTRSTRLISLLPFAALVFAACDSSTGPGVGPAAPSLGSAATYGVLAGTAVSCAGPVGTVHADVGIFPGSAISGFPTCTVTGTQRIATALAGTAQGNLTVAYNKLAGLACGTTISADLGGTTLAPGVYCSASTGGVTGALTLDGQGHSNAVFVIQSGSALTVAGSVVLIGSAQAKNVYWQVGSSATIGTSSVMKGNILALSSISFNADATLLGRALARNGAVSLGSNNSITLP